MGFALSLFFLPISYQFSVKIPTFWLKLGCQIFRNIHSWHGKSSIFNLRLGLASLLLQRHNSARLLLIHVKCLVTDSA